MSEKKSSRFKRRQLGEGLRRRRFSRRDEEESPESSNEEENSEDTPDQENDEQEAPEEDDSPDEEPSKPARRSRRGRAESRSSRRSRKTKSRKSEDNEEEQETPEIAPEAKSPNQPELAILEPSPPLSERLQALKFQAYAFLHEFWSFLVQEYRRLITPELLENTREGGATILSTLLFLLSVVIMAMLATGLGYLASQNLKPLIYELL